MDNLWFAVFSLLILLPLIHGIAKPERFYRYPYFMAAAFAVFLLPQSVSLRRFPGGVPLESIPQVLLMAVLCLGACLASARLPKSRALARLLDRPVALERLLPPAAVFVGAAFFFSFLIWQMPPEERGGSMWTGRVTIYHFFTQLVYPGFAIALFAALRGRSPAAWLLVGVAALIPLHSILFAARREPAALFALTVLLALYFQRSFRPPRFAAAAALAFALVAIPATGSIRTVLQEEGFESVRKIDFVGNFRRFLNETSILELRNAAAVIYATKLRSDYQFGTAYWDELVWRYIPAQFVGAETKDGLMFRPRLVEKTGGPETVNLGMREYAMPVGSTVTGLADSFRQFGYFGSLFFLLLGLLFRTLWESSQRPGAYLPQLLYILSTTSAMRALTHQTVDFLPGFLYFAIFLGMAAIYARSPTTRKRAAAGTGSSSTLRTNAAPLSGASPQQPRRSASPPPTLAPAEKRPLDEILGD